MVVIGRGDHHSVDVLLFLIEQHSVVTVLLGLGEHLERVGASLRVHVAERHNVLAHYVPDVVESLTTNPDAGDIEFFTRRWYSWAAQHTPRNNRNRSH